MDGFRIELKGLDRFADMLAAMGSGMKNANRSALRQCANIALRIVRPRTPVYTGILRASWFTKVNNTATGGEAVVSVRDKEVAPPLKGGTFKFLSPLDKKSRGYYILQQRMFKPKNPALYVGVVNRESKVNAGFADAAWDAAAPEVEASYMKIFTDKVTTYRARTAQ